jgi:hypothetical protein
MILVIANELMVSVKIVGVTKLVHRILPLRVYKIIGQSTYPDRLIMTIIRNQRLVTISNHADYIDFVQSRDRLG